MQKINKKGKEKELLGYEISNIHIAVIIVTQKHFYMYTCTKETGISHAFSGFFDPADPN